MSGLKQAQYQSVENAVLNAINSIANVLEPDSKGQFSKTITRIDPKNGKTALSIIMDERNAVFEANGLFVLAERGEEVQLNHNTIYTPEGRKTASGGKLRLYPIKKGEGESIARSIVQAALKVEQKAPIPSQNMISQLQEVMGKSGPGLPPAGLERR